MPIAMEDGFYQNHDQSGYSSLGIETRRLAECVQRIVERRILGVFGSEHFGFAETDVDFLRAMPWVESVWAGGTTFKNIDGLYALENLCDLSVSAKRPALDFSRLPTLRHAVIDYKATDRALETLRELALLHLWRCSPKDATFSTLKLPASLTALHINWSNVASLATLPALPNLRRLEVHRCRNLVDLGMLREKFPLLDYLVVDACGRVTSAEGARAIGGLHQLTRARISKVELV